MAAAVSSPCIVHGIPNCDQIKKARAWLEARSITYRFHDFKREGLNPALLDEWVRHLRWETLLNRKGTTWRKLPEAQRPQDEAGAVALMLAQPSVIKRPILAVEKRLLVGFSEAEYSKLFS